MDYALVMLSACRSPTGRTCLLLVSLRPRTTLKLCLLRTPRMIRVVKVTNPYLE
nr:MAG TPA: hypothetical protein [Caudoviricetes sp.]DAV07929.1 MAG TPA: hypothetical protein [Caudoviricetes sp.]